MLRSPRRVEKIRKVLAQRQPDVLSDRHGVEQRAGLEEHPHPLPQLEELQDIAVHDLDHGRLLVGSSGLRSLQHAGAGLR